MAKGTKKRRKSQKLSKNPAQESPKTDPAATEQVFETFVQSNEAILAGMVALNSEMATFCNERLRENVGRPGSLLGCSDAEEAFNPMGFLPKSRRAVSQSDKQSPGNHGQDDWGIFNAVSAAAEKYDAAPDRIGRW